MTLRRPFAPMLPEFDAFLFASIGDEVDGVPLSVLSALSRLGLDPRDEAARLARLTKEAAADQLARMIPRLSDPRWNLLEARRIASGLIELLPRGSAAAMDEDTVRSIRPTTHLKSSPFLIYLALALAILVSLIASGYLPLG